MGKILLNVNGMKCNGCENRIKNALMTIDGVEDVKANYIDGTVEIISNNENIETEIKEKIIDIGFEIK